LHGSRNIKIRRPKDYAPGENPLVNAGKYEENVKKTYNR